MVRVEWLDKWKWLRRRGTTEGTREEEDTSYSLNEGGTSRQAGATHTYYPENNNIRVSIYMSFRRQVGPGCWRRRSGCL